MKLYIRDPLRLIVVFYFLGMILLHYLVIGKILPQIRSDISIHLEYTETLLSNPLTYNAYPYLGFHLILSPLYILFNRETVYQVASLLVFLNILLGATAYTFLKRLFSSVFPAFFGTLILISGNNTLLIDRVTQYSFTNISNDVFKILNIMPLLFDSRYNIVSYILIQFFPFSISFTLICLSLLCIITDNYHKNMRAFITRRGLIIFSIFIIYLLHPLYAFLILILLLLLILVRNYIVERKITLQYVNNLILWIMAAGFIPALIAYISPNASQTYRFQSLTFCTLNVIVSFFVLFFLKRVNSIMYIIRKLYNFSTTNLKYLFFLFIACIWIFSLFSVSTLEELNAWSLMVQPTPILLYPVIIGIGPVLISGTLLFVKDYNAIILSWICMLLPFPFVCAASLIDYINFYVLGFQEIDGYIIYSGVTSGRMLAIANLLYNINSGLAIGFAIKQSTRRHLSFLIGIMILILLLTSFSITSLKYWGLVYALSLNSLQNP